MTEVNGKIACYINLARHNYLITIGNLAIYNEALNIWIEADSLAKSFNAIIMADLGQNSCVNMLVNEIALEYFITTLTNTIGGQDSSVI